MKDKKLTYILFLAVLLFLGIAGYKLYVRFFGEGDSIALNTELVSEEKEKAFTDHFEIENNYRDPFLGNAVSEVYQKNVVAQQIAIPAKRQTTAVVSAPKPIVRWPLIKIGGVVNSRKLMATIDGKSVLLDLGKQVQNVIFLKSTKDSVWLQYSGDQKSFSLR